MLRDNFAAQNAVKVNLRVGLRFATQIAYGAVVSATFTRLTTTPLSIHLSGFEARCAMATTTRGYCGNTAPALRSQRLVGWQVSVSSLIGI
jgi:hypothetical protein